MTPRKRRTFHVDWDSPSHETGTVRRRPVSFETTTSVPVSTDRRLENVEYYEVKDCVGGYGLTLLGSIDGRPIENRNAVPGFLASSESNGTEAVNDNGNGLITERGPPSSATACEEDTRCDEVEKEEGRTCDSKDRAFSYFTDREEEKFSNGIKGGIGFKSGEESWKTSNARKDFGLRLCERSYEWRSKAPRRRSLIPKPKTRGYVGSRGVVNSSSESSGIGSPLSPLSPSNGDGSTIAKGGSIKSSSSKSSGFGSPDEDRSPLSPESQGYAAFYLIEQQLEKLRNCGCERRQAQVK